MGTDERGELAAGLRAVAREIATRGMPGAAPLPGLTPRAARTIAKMLERAAARESGTTTIVVAGHWRPGT